MRRSAIALALGAVLALPIASSGDGDDEPEAAAAADGESEASDAPAPTTVGPAPTSRRAPRRSDIAPRDVEPAGTEAEGEGEEDDEPGFWAEYLESARARVLTGLNGIATGPADPVMATVDTPKAFAKAGYVRRPLGFASGCLQMLYRTFSGVVDVGFSPIPWLPVVSPVPRYKLIPGFEHEDE